MLLVTGERRDIKKMAEQIYNSLCQGTRMVILQDIICCRRNPTGSYALERLEERLQYEMFNPNKNEFVLFTLHRCDGWENFHVYHACSYRKSYCCCSITKNQNIIPSRRRAVSKSKLTKEDFIRILNYHSSERRQIRYLGIEGIGWRFHAQDRDCTDGVRLPEGFMEVCQFESSNLPAGGRPHSNDVGRFETRDPGAHCEPGGRDKDKWVKTVDTFLHNYICVPVRNALCLNEWRILPGHLNVNKHSYKVINVIEDIEFKYLAYTVRDFYDLY